MLSIELTILGLSLVLALSTYPARVKPLTVNPLPSLANSTRANSTGVERRLDIRCTGEYFGVHPSISDCQSALRHIAPDHEQFLWGLRHTGLDDSVFPLPYRILGGGFFRHDKQRLLTALPQQIEDCASSRLLSLIKTSRSHAQACIKCGKLRTL